MNDRASTEILIRYLLTPQTSSFVHDLPLAALERVYSAHPSMHPIVSAVKSGTHARIYAALALGALEDPKDSRRHAQLRAFVAHSKPRTWLVMLRK